MLFRSFTRSLRLVCNVSTVALVATLTVYGVYRLALPSGATDISASAATRSFPDPAVDPVPATVGEQTAVFAGGCFWGMEAVFEHVKGVSDVVSGYSGGASATAHYEEVSSGNTGHAEAVKITYDPSQISYGQLLKIYFSVAHDPTQLNRQGPDWGTQYRSAIFYTSNEQRQVAQAYIDQLNGVPVFSNPVVTQIIALNEFYAAEDYHQNFIDRNPGYPYVVVNDLPKLEHLQAQFPGIYRN